MKLNTMRTILFSLLLFGGIFNQSVLAQRGGEKMKQLRIAFITEKLDLTVEEAQQFWPIYNAHEDKRMALDKKIRQNFQALKSAGESVSETELLKRISDISVARAELAELDKKYVEDCLPVIGTAKCARLLAAEEEFKREVLRRLKENRGPRP